MDTILRLEHVSISYKIGDFKDIGLKEWTMRHLKHNYRVETFMAVNDVSFTMEKGDMIGIIGANGAGKSTLLKAITGVMEPRSGVITRRGKVVALLELASGFDGDLTVKENAYLRGAMLGYTREFMDRKYKEILDFSELWEFEDRPFKQLSTGMQSRLAFSIASMVQPEILVLDEVLSVGDGAFQEKSAKKMREIIHGGAGTILVSHTLAQIRELCNKVLWLDRGAQIVFGETQAVCDAYEAYLSGDHSNAAEFRDRMPEPETIPEPEETALPEEVSEPEETALPEETPEPEETAVPVDASVPPEGPAPEGQTLPEALLSDGEYLSRLRYALSRTPCIWGDPARLHIDPTAILNDALLNVNCGSITVGAYSFTGHGVSILTGTHYMERKDEKRMAYPGEGNDIVIGRGVWMASNSTILGPCRIGDHAVIAGGSVIVPGTEIPAGTLWGGNPARQLREIKLENRE